MKVEPLTTSTVPVALSFSPRKTWPLTLKVEPPSTRSQGRPRWSGWPSALSMTKPEPSMTTVAPPSTVMPGDCGDAAVPVPRAMVK